MITRNRPEKTLRYGLSLPSVHTMFLRFGVFLCIFGAVTSTASTCTPCPSLCSCTLKSGTTNECEVDCQGRGIKTIPTAAELPPASNTVKLDLSNNDIDEVPRTNISFLTNLRDLSLRGNNIYSLEGSTFNDITTLEILDLSSNHISDFPNNMFKSSVNIIKELNISHLELTSVKENFLKELWEIERLDLSYNKITVLTANMFSQNTHLQVLKLHNNDLVSVDLERHKISYIDLSYNKLTSVAASNLVTSLHQLDLTGNLIQTMDPTVLDQLPGLHNISLAENPWECTCSLKEFHDKLLELETSSGLVLVDRENIRCNNMMNVPMLNLTSRAHWCPDEFASCYDDLEEIRKVPVAFSMSAGTSVIQDCIENCFDNNATYGVNASGVCLCGNEMTGYGDCYCPRKNYSSGENIVCQGALGTLYKTYASNVFQVKSGLKFDHVGTITAGQQHVFTARVSLRTITSYTWYFGDTATPQTKMVSLQYCSNAYTYLVPGTYTLTVGILSTQGGYSSGSITVEVVPPTSLITPSIQCPSAINFETGATGSSAVSAVFTMAHKLEFTWSRSPDDNITSTTGGECGSTHTEYHGRCLSSPASVYSYSQGVTHCFPDIMLSIHFPSELSDVLSQFGGSVTNGIYLDAKKSGTEYYWSTGGKAYFTTADVANSGVGECVYISKSTSNLEGTDCGNTYSVICQSEPKPCHSGGFLYSGNGHCYKLLTSTQDWSAANTACKAVDTTARLAKIDSAAVQSFLVTNVVTSGEVWTGLTDRNMEGQLEWSDGEIWSSYPTVTATEVDCFSMNSAGNWQAKSCTVSLQALCEYSSREVASVPSYVAGTAQLMTTSYSLTTLAPSTTPHVADRNIMSLFPGLWINREGNARAWNFRSTPGRTEPIALTLMVLEPVCQSPNHFMPPGCNQHGAQFGSCVSSAPTCTKTSTCDSHEDYCLISDSCIPKTDPCSCAGTSSFTACINFFVSSAQHPKYRVRGQTYVNLPPGGEEEYTVPVTEFTVYENDVLAFATNASVDVIKCDSNTGSTWEQTLNSISSTNWANVNDEITLTATFAQNRFCYFNLLYSAKQQESLPSTLQYFTNPDTYTYSLIVPSLSGSPQTATLKAEEEVGEITWIHPPKQSTTSVNVLDDTDTYFVFSVTKGTHLTAKWTKDGVDTTTAFQSSCPASIASKYPTECSQANRPLVFSYQLYKFLKSNGASQTITVLVYNDLTMQKTQHITVNLLLPLSGLNVYLESPSIDNVVEVGSPTTFITNITNGSPSSYSLSYNGSATMQTSNSSSITYTFPSKATYLVTVTATDGLTNTTAEITVRGKCRAGIQGLAFANQGENLAATYTHSIMATATAVAGAEVSVTWQQDNSTLQTSTTVIGSSAFSVSRDFTFASAGNYTIAINITDEFGESKNTSMVVEVIDPIKNFYLQAINVYVEKGKNAKFAAKMDSAPRTHGVIYYTFDYGDGTAKEENITDGTRQHAYTAAGNYNVTCLATNGPSSAFHSLILYVQEKITDFAVDGDLYILLGTQQNYTANVSGGTSLSFQFRIDSLSYDTGFTPSNVFTFTFTTAGSYNLTIFARNDIDFQKIVLEIHAVSASTLIIKSLTHDRNVEQNSDVSMNISVIHHDASQLSVFWNYGDSVTETGIGKLSALHNYTTAGDFNITVTVTDTSLSNSNTKTSLITVARRIQGLSLTNNGPGKVNSTSGATVTVTATLTDGTNLNFIWTHNGVDYDTGVTNYINLNFTTAGTHTVSVNASNPISSETASTSFNVQAMIENLQLSCATCVVDASGNYFLEAGVSTSFTATYTGGSDLNFIYNFDGTPSASQTTPSLSHTYSAGNRTMSLTASNDVDSATINVSIAAQSRITNVAFPSSSIMPTIALTSVPMNYTLLVTGGSDVKYVWKYCNSCPEILHETDSITNPGYSNANHYQLNGTAYNMISMKSATVQITIVNLLTIVNISSDLIADEYAITGTAYTFYALPNVHHPPNSNSYKYFVSLTSSAYHTTASSTDQNFTHPFPSPGDYKLKVEVDNVKSNVHAEIFVHVQDQVSSPTIASNVSSDISTGSAAQLTVSVTSGSSIGYEWSIEENGVTQTLPSTTNTLEYLFSDKGNFTIRVNVSNIVSWKIATYHQQVMDAIENISFTNNINTTTYPYVAKGKDVTFTSVIGKGDAYTITWSILDTTNTIMTTSVGATFVYAFTSAETYTVKMKVQNAVSSQQTDIVIHVQVPLNSLVLSPTKSVAKTSESIDLVAVHNTDATHLTYTWNIEGTTSTTATNTKSYAFPSAGKYTVSVTVTNRLSSKTADVNITVQDVIQDLAVTGCDQEAIEDTSVAMAATTSAGTDVTYHWQVINGATHTGANFSTMFATTGKYSITVNASNLVDSKVVTCQMTIIGIISDLHIDMRNSVFFVNYSMQFVVGGNNLVGVQYNWTFTGPVTINWIATNNFLLKKFADPGQYTGTLVVSNSISQASKSVDFEIKPLTCDAPTVVALGNSDRTIFKSSPVFFELEVDMQGCMDYIIKYSWVLSSASSASCSGSLTAFTLPTTVYGGSSSLTIPGQTLPYGHYCLRVSAEYENTPLKVTKEYTITVTESPLVALLSGGNALRVSNLNSVTLDGTTSYDRDDNSTLLVYSWACSIISGSTTPSACGDVTAAATGTVTMNSNNMVVGQKYLISLTVSSPGRTSGSTSVEVDVVGGDVPLVSIRCISCSAKNNHVVNPGDMVMLEGGCSNCATASSVTYTWTAKYGTNTLTLDSTTTSTDNDKINLVVNANQLPAASAYKFKLEIQKTVSGTVSSGYTKLTLDGNSAPSGGSCSLSPASVKSLENLVTFTCTGYSDPGSSSTELYYRVKSYSSDGKESVGLYYGSSSTAKIFVAPWPGTARNAVKIKIFVEDEHGAQTEALSQSIGITPPSLSSLTNTEYIHSLANSTLSNLVLANNPSMILLYCIAMVHEINEQSRQVTSTTASQELALRTKVRNAITLAAMGLPLKSLHEMEQTAFILEHLTKYDTEFQTKESQTIALNQIDSLKSSMSSSQGIDGNSVLTSHLMACISNLMDAANAGVYDAESVVNSTKSLEASLITSFKANISSSDTQSATRSDEDHKKFIINKAFENSEEIITVNVKNQILGQNPVEVEVSGIKFYGQRAKSEEPSTLYQTQGVAIQISNDVLTGIVSPGTEILQLIMGISRNPFTWGYSTSKVNSKILTMSFKETSGVNLNVQQLAESRSLKFYLPDSTKNGYSNIDAGGLISNPAYDPSEGLTMATYEIEKSSKKKININTAGAYTGHALHIQLRISLINDSLETPLDKVDFYLGKGYEATSSMYEQKLTVETAHMVAGMDHANYTMFIDSMSFDPSAAYTITVYNDDTNFAYNISAAIYMSSCGFYDPSSETWSGAGCYPTAESLPVYTTCMCNHMTPFGGSMLVPPNAISFSDLVNLDLTNNPVVFITCSVIFVIYIVTVIVCRRMDKIDLDRIATVPLCGKDGSFKYQITVVTGKTRGAGTTAHVGIKLYGEYGKSKERQLHKDGAFQRNCVDSFFIANDTNLGNIHKIMIWHDNFGLDPSWHLIQVIIKDMQTEKKYYFFGNCWMTLEKEHGYIQKEIKAAGSSEIKRFSRMFSHAVSNSMADRHLWVSILDRPANSRFTRVQRATVAVTLLYVFMGVNAMWYGVLKTTNTSDTSQGISSFGWEEVVLALLCNIMVFPFSLLLIFIFKKSRSKTTEFEARPQTAKTIEIENDLDGSQCSSSFRTESQSDLLSCMERESTIDSALIQPTQPLRKTKTLKTSRKGLEETAVKVPLPDGAEGGYQEKSRLQWKRTNNPRIWNDQSIMDSWPDRIPKYNDRQNTPKTGQRNPEKEQEVREAADDILNYLDCVEQDAMAKESKRASMLGGGAAKPLTRKSTLAQKKLDDLDDALMDDEIKPKHKPIQRRVSTVSIGSGKPPNSSGSQKNFNPRQDPNIRKPPSAGSSNVSKWVSKLHTTSTGVSLPEVEHIGPLEPDMGLAQRTGTELYTDGYSEMAEEVAVPTKKNCTLPGKCIYLGHVLCFLLSATSCILVILYGQKFGADIALQWLLALLFSFIFSFLFVEPLKAVFIALYLAAWEKKTEDTDDVIDNEPKFDMSNELVKEVKFSPLSGFALLKAKEDGIKIQRMRLMLRQFVAYMFYLLLVMALCYTNFTQHTYNMSQAVEKSFVRPTMPNTNKSFKNITSIEELWQWTQSVLISGLHYDELTSYTEFNTLLGVARLRQVRGLREVCPVKDYPLHAGLDSLAGVIDCEGSLGYTEDKYHYGYMWNITQSQNLSWRYHTESQTGSKRRELNVFSYNGGGYVQYLGSSFNESLTALQDLQSKNWIDLRTRALFIDFTLYNPAEDLTTFTTLMVEFPLTGGINMTFDIQTHHLLRFIDGVVDPIMVCEVILFVVVFYYLVHIALQIRELGKSYFCDVWNWLEMLTTLMAIVSIGLYIGCVATATDTFSSFLNNQRAFTNFERVADIHTAARYLHAWLLFLLVFKVVKQIRFIKFLHKFEKTLNNAFPKLMGVMLIFGILYLTHGMIAYLFLGNHMDGFENYWTTLMTLLGMIRGTFNFFPLLEMDTIFTHFLFYSLYIFTYGLTIALIIAVLNDSYKQVKSQLYYKSTLDLQDYEMIDFMMRRFKLWAGFEKPKEKTRRVHFEGQRSVSDRCSTSHSNRSYSELEEVPAPVPPKPSRSAAAVLSSRWEDLLKTMKRVEYLDEKEDEMIAKTQKEVDEWGFQSRIKNYESERQGLLQWKQTPSGDRGRPVTKMPHRTMTQKSLPGKTDLQPSSSAGGPVKPTITSKGGQRPLSDGGRIAAENVSEARPLGSRERKSIYNFFKSIKPSKSAWNN